MKIDIDDTTLAKIRKVSDNFDSLEDAVNIFVRTGFAEFKIQMIINQADDTVEKLKGVIDDA